MTNPHIHRQAVIDTAIQHAADQLGHTTSTTRLRRQVEHLAMGWYADLGDDPAAIAELIVANRRAAADRAARRRLAAVDPDTGEIELHPPTPGPEAERDDDPDTHDPADDTGQTPDHLEHDPAAEEPETDDPASRLDEILDHATHAVMNIIDHHLDDDRARQLALFDGHPVDLRRLTITGATTSDDQTLPPFELGDQVHLHVVGTITKVTGARTKDDRIERQHVLVVDTIEITPR